MDEIEVMRRIAELRSQEQSKADREMREREEGGGMTQAERGALAKIIGMAMKPGDEGYRAKRMERPKQFKNGGVVKKKAPKFSKAKKSRNGCVMAGRGGKYKGMS